QMLVSDILRRKGRDVVCAPPTQSVTEAARLMATKGIGSVLVLSDGSIAGILSERDIVRGLSELGTACLAKPVAELMTRTVVTCSPQERIDRVMELMTDGRFRHVPVVEHGRLVGLVSIGDVVKHRLEEAQAEVEHLSAYVAGQ
ncbi:MAG: CBS domain-containing protein, partial [Bauldia litoralis]